MGLIDKAKDAVLGRDDTTDETEQARSLDGADGDQHGDKADVLQREAAERMNAERMKD